MMLASENTKGTYKASVDMYDRFVSSQATEQFPKFQQITYEYLSCDAEKLVSPSDKLKELTIHFSTYLLNDAKKSDGSFYASRSLPNYLSNWFTQLSKKVELSSKIDFKAIKGNWYDDWYQMFSLRSSSNAIRRGEAVSKRQLSLRRTLMKRMLMYLVKLNDANSTDFYNR